MEFNLLSLLLVFLASVLGSMGLGGGSLLLLYLMLFTDLPQAEAQAINLFLFLPTAAVAILLHKKNGLLQGSVLKKWLPAGLLGAILGSLISSSLKSPLLRKIFGVFLLIMGLRELWALYRQQKLPPQA